LTADADEIMRQRGIVVVPDILANAGGVVGSYVEWANNKMGQIISDEEAKKLIVDRMNNAFNTLYDYHQKKLEDHDLRTAAMALAADRVVESYES